MLIIEAQTIEHTWRRDPDQSLDFIRTCIIPAALTVSSYCILYSAINKLFMTIMVVDGSLNSLTTTTRKRSRLHQGAEEPEHLPCGIFLVDRLVTTKPSKTHNVSIHAYISIQRSSISKYYYLCAQGHVEYLVLWEGYPKEEASWVLDTDVTAPAIE